MKHEEQALSRGLMRMTHAKLAAVYGTWRETAGEMKDGKRKLSGAVQRMLKRALSASFETWQAIGQFTWNRLPKRSHRDNGARTDGGVPPGQWRKNR